MNDRAAAAADRGELARAGGLYREALRLAESVEDFRSIGINSLNLAAVYQALGQLDSAQRVLDRVASAPSRFGAPLFAEAAGRKAQLELQAGDLEAAGRWLDRAENECRGTDCRSAVALLNTRGQLALARGSAAEARAVAARALAASRAAGNREEQANALRLDGRAAAALGEHAQAAASLGQALDLDKQLEQPYKIALDLLALAEASLAAGRKDAARDYAQRALQASRANGHPGQQQAAQALLDGTR